MTKPQWEQISGHDGGVFAAELAGKQLTVYRDLQGALRLLWSVMGDRSQALAATSAREAQEEALDIVWRWAWDLMAAVEEMQGAKSDA